MQCIGKLLQPVILNFLPKLHVDITGIVLRYCRCAVGVPMQHTNFV